MQRFQSRKSRVKRKKQLPFPMDLAKEKEAKIFYVVPSPIMTEIWDALRRKKVTHLSCDCFETCSKFLRLSSVYMQQQPLKNTVQIASTISRNLFEHTCI